MNSDNYSRLTEQDLTWIRKTADADVVPDDTVPEGYVRDDASGGQLITIERWLKRLEKRAKKNNNWAQMRDELAALREKYGVPR